MRASFEYSALNGLLQRWGDWQERHAEDVSLPHQAAFTMLYADQPPGHRILCAEMPHSIYVLNWHIARLQPRSREALYLWYAISLKPPEGHWTAQEKAQKLGWSLNGFRIRVHRARKALASRVAI